MDAKPFIVVSDLHLGAVPPETERQFRAFLRFAQRNASGLLINGDLFDFYFEYRSVIPRLHFRVLAALAELTEAGVPVWFVGGNHDAWTGDFLRNEVGLWLIDGPVAVELAGRRCLVAHGDGVGAGDYKYRALRRVIRHPAVVAAFRQIHPDWGHRIAGAVSSTEHKARLHDPASASRAQPIVKWATEQLRADPSLDLVLAGHSHTPALVEVEPGRFYINSGDWIRHFTFVEIPPPPQPPRLLRWTGTAGADWESSDG